MKLYKLKKAISPVVATSLLLVIAVASVVGFQGWFTEFSAKISTDIELESSSNSITKIEALINNKIYLKSDSLDIIKEFKIIDNTGNTVCEIKDNEQTNISADTTLLLSFDINTYNTTHIKDLTGYQNDFINLNSPIHKSTNCLSGNCFEFDGTGQNLLSTTYNPLNFTTNSQFTISIWFSTTDTTKSRQYILRKDGVDGDRSSISININNGYSHIEFCPKECGLSYIEITTNSSSGPLLTDGQFHNIILVKENANAKVYVDGILRNDVTNESIINGDYATANNISIGINPRNFNQNRAYNGTIDEVSIYSKSITKQEVELLYKAKQIKFYEQLLPQGIKNIDLSSCNLESKKPYTIIILTDSKIIEQTIMKK
ncbi:MAG: LamG domain-containing protein [Nanoarchaeales archaeon]|nr:LamG domain-containing protein [Nanoarchaeales archaeon]